MRLLAGDWDTKGPLRLNESLRPTDLRHSRFFNNGRTFLSAVAENDSVKGTSAGNLNRKFVSEMLERMEWEPGWIEVRKSSLFDRFLQFDF